MELTGASATQVFRTHTPYKIDINALHMVYKACSLRFGSAMKSAPSAGDVDVARWWIDLGVEMARSVVERAQLHRE